MEFEEETEISFAIEFIFSCKDKDSLFNFFESIDWSFVFIFSFKYSFEFKEILILLSLLLLLLLILFVIFKSLLSLFNSFSKSITHGCSKISLTLIRFLFSGVNNSKRKIKLVKI